MADQGKKSLCLVLLLCSLGQLVRTEMFTALVELQKALTAERAIAEDIRHYVRLEENRIQLLRQIADDYEEHSNIASVDPENYLSNPINAFLLVKRFTADWGRVEELVRNNTADDFMGRVQAKASSFPNQEDLNGAASALLRLQDTYALNTAKLAKGEIQGVRTSPPLNVEDCFDLGQVAYNDGDFYHTILWMEQALNLMDENDRKDESGRLNRPTILDYLSYSTFMQGNTRAAYNYTLKWLQIEPDHIRAQNNRRFYEEQMKIEEEERRKGDEGTPPPAFQNKRILDDYRSSEEFQTYERLCRGEDVFVIPDEHKLTCQFRRHAPIFYIRPLKEETVYFDPLIIIYHDVMVDVEIAKIKELASPRLDRSGVFMAPGVTHQTQKYRTSQTAWLHDWEHPLVQQVSTKVRYLANLTLDTAEELQVVNYGIGGHYEPHYDFARKREPNSFEHWRGNRIATSIFYKEEKGGFDPSGGNRIATSIFYMTDVEAGGGTVFTTLGVRLWPEKGSVALWYNLKRNGEGDYSTRHAACPVLSGNKWVANKWIHERGQEFERPCDINPEL